MTRRLLLSLLLSCTALRGTQEFSDSQGECLEISNEFFEDYDGIIESYDRLQGSVIYHNPSWLEVKLQELLAWFGENPTLLDLYIQYLEYRNLLTESPSYLAYEQWAEEARAFDAIIREKVKGLTGQYGI